jgi:hypothetical protein
LLSAAGFFTAFPELQISDGTVAFHVIKPDLGPLAFDLKDFYHFSLLYTGQLGILLAGACTDDQLIMLDRDPALFAYQVLGIRFLFPVFLLSF